MPSPPQTFPEDLRVDTKLKATEVSEHNPGPIMAVTHDRDKLRTTINKQDKTDTAQSPVFMRLTPTSENVKQTLALHCHRVGNEREEKSNNKGVVAKRLKDKLQILKQ